MAKTIKILFLVIVPMLLMGCAHERMIIVPQNRETIVHQHDTIYHKDSVVEKSITIVQKADSAMMAQYGIRLGNMENAWLVLQSNSKNQSISHDKVIVRDSIVHDSVPVPYPKIEYKEKELNTIQEGEIFLGRLFIIMVLGFLFSLGFNHYMNKRL